MAKIRLTKGELKRQRDALRQYRRYLPTLQLKKQQLQLEILKKLRILEKRREFASEKTSEILKWSRLLGEKINLKPWIRPKEILKSTKNIAGVDIDIFKETVFSDAEYDLFVIPLWVDSAILGLRELVSVREEIAIVEKGIETLRRELRITTQRVNLFEKVKIPQAEKTIRLIKIYIGDQMANAVGRSKIAKRKIEEAVLQEVAV